MLLTFWMTTVPSLNSLFYSCTLFQKNYSFLTAHLFKMPMCKSQLYLLFSNILFWYCAYADIFHCIHCGILNVLINHHHHHRRRRCHRCPRHRRHHHNNKKWDQYPMGKGSISLRIILSSYNVFLDTSYSTGFWSVMTPLHYSFEYSMFAE